MDGITILTIGYGDRAYEEVEQLLLRSETTVLLDVRSQPFTRYKPEFSRNALEERLQKVHIRYVFLGHELGGHPEDESCYTNGRVDYLRVEQKEWFYKGMDRLRRAFAQNQRMMLLCSEAKPQDCHRSKLIGRALVDAGLPVLHIDELGELRTQDEVLSLMLAEQGSLFEDAPVTTTSRRTYIPRNRDRTAA
ncbi:MAG: DUF488 domain-containing protein [Armatimonadota bacterium]|nr:DUF488 domain-containing protein [Armatimonadota bacterium]